MSVVGHVLSPALTYVNDPEKGYIIEDIDETIGKGLFASKRFEKGETLFREKPIVSCQFSWNAIYGYAACHFCLEPLETAQENVVRLTNNPNILLPHSECCVTRRGFHVKCEGCGSGFCSTTCHDEAMNQFHKVLCPGEVNESDHPIANMRKLWTDFHYPPETASVMLIARILATILQSEDTGRTMNLFLSFMHDTVNKQEAMTHKLIGDGFTTVLEQVRLATVAAFPQPEIAPLLTPEGFVSLFALVGRNGQGVATSPFSQYVRKFDRLRLQEAEQVPIDKLINKIYSEMEDNVGQFLDNEGSGLFYIQSHINHSCVPNAVIAFPFNNHELVVNATKSIEPGEQIFISYVDECAHTGQSRHSRQKYLKENYLFLCKCTKCVDQADDLSETSEESMEEILDVPEEEQEQEALEETS